MKTEEIEKILIEPYGYYKS